ncbi:MAG: IPT/TIG domain-containing protein [Acidobacteria bacterium]|nr:IPT/TIG domain-containing protein [Acidobacteriota bacterium]
MKGLLLFALPLSLALGADPVQHRLPIAAAIYPMGAQPGSTFEAEILGEHLDRAQSILFHQPGASAEILSVQPTLLRLRVNVAKTAAYGQHPFHVVTPRGASGPLLLRVNDQPRVLENEPNSIASQANLVPIPATVMGRLNVDGDFDFFKFRVEKGSRWIFDLRSSRNGNSLDAAIFLLHANGAKIDYNEERFIWDPFLSHQFAEAGEYILVVQPTHVRLDPSFAYELDIRQAPHLDTVSPLVIPPGLDQEVTLLGEGLSGEARLEGAPGTVLSMEGNSARVRLRVPANTPDGPVELTLLTPGGRSNSIELLVDSTPRHSGGDRISPPTSITGVAKYRQPDLYRFTAQAGQTLVFEVRGQRFGSPVDLTMRLLDSVGKQVALNDDFTFVGGKFYQRDPRILHTFKEAGEYAVELRNVVQVVGERSPYQLLVRPPKPSYTLQLSNERPHVYPGGESPWKVSAQRLDGHNDPIALTLSGLPAGITADPVTIPAGKDEAAFLLRATGKPGTAGFVTVKSDRQNAWRSVRVSSGGGEGAAFTRLDQALLSISEKPNFSLEAQATNVNIPRGGSAVIPVAIRRENGFVTPIAFAAENLPPGVTLEAVSAPGDSNVVQLKITAAPDATLGRAPRVAILGSAAGESHEAPKITVQVD